MILSPVTLKYTFAILLRFLFQYKHALVNLNISGVCVIFTEFYHVSKTDV